MKEEILRLRDKGLTYRQIASELGTSSTKISNILNNKFAYNKGWKREKAIELRKSGMKVKDIAKELGLSIPVVSSYVSNLGIKTNRDPIRRSEIIRLSQLGFDNNLIALNLGIKSSTVYHLLYKHGLFGVRYEYDNSENLQLCQGLFIDGYSNEEISMMKGLRISEVKKYTKGCKVNKIEKPKVMKPIKKIKKEIVPHEVARDYLGKGFEKGEMPTGVKLREDRDRGKPVTFIYSDFSDNPTIRTTIMVRDSVSDEDAVERWCKKLGKKSWKLVK